MFTCVKPTEQEIRARLGEPEGHLVERKVGVPKRSELRETLVAVANSVESGEWAVLWLGIGDSGKVQGLTDAEVDSAQLEVTRVANHECYPPIPIDLCVIESGGKRCVGVVITASSKRPHFAGGAFVRIGSANRQATDALYQELIDSRHSKVGFLRPWMGKLISVHFHPEPETRSYFPRNDRDYIIRLMDAHRIEVQDMCAGTWTSHPWGQVNIGHDYLKGRLLLDVDN